MLRLRGSSQSSIRPYANAALRLGAGRTILRVVTRFSTGLPVRIVGLRALERDGRWRATATGNADQEGASARNSDRSGFARRALDSRDQIRRIPGVQVHIVNGAVKVFTRRGNDWTRRFGKIAADAWHVNAGSAIIDGEVVVPSADGTTDFSVLQNELEKRVD
jgi:hypothetical protein